jgi:hypothetical protein
MVTVGPCAMVECGCQLDPDTSVQQGSGETSESEKKGGGAATETSVSNVDGDDRGEGMGRMSVRRGEEE